MKRDSSRHIVFSPIQTPFAKKVLEEHSRIQSLSTVVLIDENGVHDKCTAIFRILPFLGLPYSILGSIGLCIPRGLVNPLYDLLGRNLGLVSKYWPFDHDIEDYKDRMLGLEGKTVAAASSQFGSS